jgi:hypothetical protein
MTSFGFMWTAAFFFYERYHVIIVLSHFFLKDLEPCPAYINKEK